MNLRELAKADAAFTVEGENAGNAEFILADKDGHEWTVTGLVGDIGFLIDTDGNAVAGRTVFATFRSERVAIDGVVVEPKKGWSFTYTDLSGKAWKLFVLYSMPDRTIGLTKVYLVLDLSKS